MKSGEKTLRVRERQELENSEDVQAEEEDRLTVVDKRILAQGEERERTGFLRKRHLAASDLLFVVSKKTWLGMTMEKRRKCGIEAI